MAKPVYFQWQNEILCKTIYPMRLEKLRDFLVYFQEVAVWAEYKEKSLDEIPEQVRAYEEAQSATLVRAAETYNSLREYFLTEDATSLLEKKYSQPDPDEILEVNNLHATFRSYFPKYDDVRKERYFVSQRIAAWKVRRQSLQRRISSQQRRVDSIQPDHPKRPEEEEKLDRLQSVTLAMLDDELDQLIAFEEAIGNIEARKLELDRTRKNLLRRKNELARQLNGLQARITPLETKKDELSAEQTRLQNPPDRNALEAYFLNEDVSEPVRAEYPEIDTSTLDTINAIHKEFAQNYAYAKSLDGKAGTARTYYWRMREVQRTTQREVAKLEADLRNMPPNWSHRAEREAALVNKRDTSLPVITAELNKLMDFQAALLNAQKSEAEIKSMLDAKAKELAGVEENLSELQSQAAELQTELDEIEAKLAVPEEEKLVKYTPEKPVTVRDIALWKAQAYEESLENKNQYELLDEIHQRFMREPERYPLWLQYMVVHFSGMRYASAHGSWADPKDLLVRLREPDVEEEVKNMDDETVARECAERVAAYEGNATPRPKLSDATEKEWTQKIGWYLPNLKSNSPSWRRRGLMDMRKAEQAYEIMSMPTQEALDALLAMKDQFPAWAWKLIVKLTPLRLTEVTDPGWEKLTPAEEQESYSHENYPMRRLIDEWANFDATAWRAEHGRTHELIVTRAVCNETAEHIQHLRGRLPPGGLTPKPGWYRKNEKEDIIHGNPEPYYVKANTAEQYTPGASVLWLRFVNSMPNPWQVAKPVETKDKVGLLPGTFMRGKGEGGKNDSSWKYKMAEVTTRERFLYAQDAKGHKGGRKTKQQQFLRWIHEATVVEVAETAEGTMVITYETALPDDYKGTSSIGIFKKPLRYFLADFMVEGNEDTYNRSFVGYVPEGDVPVEHLHKMLDWEKIFRK
ncbi:MAG: hypothetical protein PVJ21_03910 [Anaerolineales bacterium]